MQRHLRGLKQFDVPVESNSSVRLSRLPGVTGAKGECSRARRSPNEWRQGILGQSPIECTTQDMYSDIGGPVAPNLSDTTS